MKSKISRLLLIVAGKIIMMAFRLDPDIPHCGAIDVSTNEIVEVPEEVQARLTQIAQDYPEEVL